MTNIDYNVAMLRLFFKEREFSQVEIQRLLETNPFNREFTEWEKNTIYNNRTFAMIIRKYNLLNTGAKIREIVVHEDASVSKSFYGDNEYCIINPQKQLRADVSSDRLTIVKGLYLGEEDFLKKLILYRAPFILGTTSSLSTFEEERDVFREYASKYDLYKIEDNNLRNKTILLKSKY